MNMPRAAITWSAFGSLAVGPVIFVAWAIWSTGQAVHPIEVRLALGPAASLLFALLGVLLAVVRLSARPATPESALLAVATAFGICEVLAFSYSVLAVAFGIPAAP